MSKQSSEGAPKKRGRPTIQEEPMIKTHKRLSLPASLMGWLEEQPNQAETIRQSLELFKEGAIAKLPSVKLEQKRNLPKAAIVYLVLNQSNDVLYVGQTQNGKARWDRHHKLKELKGMQGVRIAWIEVSESFLLRTIESALIEWFDPPLNAELGGKRPGAGRRSDWKLGQTSVIRVPAVLASQITKFSREIDTRALHKEDAIALIEQAIAFIQTETEF